MGSLLKLSTITLAVILLASCGHSQQGTVALHNGSGHRLTQLHIVVAGQTFDFVGVEPGRSVQTTYTVRGESHYDVTATLDDGRVVKGSVGYVDTVYSSTHDQLELTATSVMDVTPSGSINPSSDRSAVKT
jgi:hypothetical protein